MYPIRNLLFFTRNIETGYIFVCIFKEKLLSFIRIRISFAKFIDLVRKFLIYQRSIVEYTRRHDKYTWLRVRDLICKGISTVLGRFTLFVDLWSYSCLTLSDFSAFSIDICTRCVMARRGMSAVPFHNGADFSLKAIVCFEDCIRNIDARERKILSRETFIYEIFGKKTMQMFFRLINVACNNNK